MNSSLNWLTPLIPETIVILTALGVLTLDFALARRETIAVRTKVIGLTACMGCIAAMIWMAFREDYRAVEMIALTPLTQFLKLLLLGLAIIVANLSIGSKFSRHVGEYFALLLFATVGLMLLLSSENLLVIFIALELLSVPLYALAAFNKSSLASAEAALKYFLLGSVSAAFTLFGVSLLYGITGEISLRPIAEHFRAAPIEPVACVALLMTLTGFAFKVAAAPFHFWSPDVYQGAPTPIASFIASASKVASFFVLARIVVNGFGPLSGSATSDLQSGWMPLVALLAVLSMVLGNLAALAQSNIKRLLAYSAIAHAGYALLAFFGNSKQMLPSLLFYVITYSITVLGAFAVVGVVEENGIDGKITNWAGLSRKSPVLSACMFVFMLSLAGIPPLSGFFGKFYIFTAATAGAPRFGMLWLVILAVAASAISLYYYLQVLKQIYTAEPSPDAESFRPSQFALLPILLLAVLVIAFGCAPAWLLGKLSIVLTTSAF
jgi:NADH-quinone oxidoreductase subunit N